MDFEEKITNTKNLVHSSNMTMYSINFMRNLQREFCLILNNIRKLESKIKSVKKSKEYFEFTENQALVLTYKDEIDVLNKIEKKMVKKNSVNFGKQLKKV